MKCDRLKKVDYTKIEGNIGNITDFSFKWVQLTDIKLLQAPSDWRGPIENTTLLNLVTILGLTPRLIKCHFEISRVATNTGLSPSSSISSLPLPNLQKMVFHGGTNYGPLFELLII